MHARASGEESLPRSLALISLILCSRPRLPLAPHCAVATLLLRLQHEHNGCNGQNADAEHCNDQRRRCGAACSGLDAAHGGVNEPGQNIEGRERERGRGGRRCDAAAEWSLKSRG